MKGPESRKTRRTAKKKKKSNKLNARGNTSFGIRDLSRDERHQKNWVGKGDTSCQKEVHLPIRGLKRTIRRAASADVREHAVYK